MLFFSVKSVINHFDSIGSSIFIASFDVSKVFDKVNHIKLFNSLIEVLLFKCYVIGMLKCFLLYVGIIVYSVWLLWKMVSDRAADCLMLVVMSITNLSDIFYMQITLS